MRWILAIISRTANCGLSPNRRTCVIVTKDADFSDRILVSTPPPWIVHLRFGNMRRQEFHRFLAALWPQVEALLPANKLVCVYADRIEAFG